MLKLVLYYDWLYLRASRLLLAGPGLLAVCVILSLLVGQQRVASQLRTQAALQQAEARGQAHLAAQLRAYAAHPPTEADALHDPRDPFGAGLRAPFRYAALPPAPLALVAVGQSDLLPSYYKPTVFARQSLYHAAEIEHPAILLSGHFDLAFVLVYLLPLFVIGLTYDLVAAEQQQGTWRLLLLSQPAAGPVVLGRGLLRWALLNAAVAAPLLVAAALGEAGLRAAGPALGTVLLLTLGYSAFWLGLSYWVNSWGRSGGYNAAALVGAWLALVVLVPALLSQVAATVHPLPSRVALVQLSRTAADSARHKGSQLLARYLEDHPELAPKAGATEGFAVQNARVRLAVAAATAPLEAEFATQRTRQQTLIERYRWLSPALLVQPTLTEAAGTGPRRFADFDQQVDAYFRRFQSFFLGKVFQSQKMTEASAATVPTFRYRPLPANSVLAVPLLLGLTALGLLALGYHQLRVTAGGVLPAHP